jgi:hypothetical protein
MGEGNPLGRLASPREIGKAALFRQRRIRIHHGRRTLWGRRHGAGLRFWLMRAGRVAVRGEEGRGFRLWFARWVSWSSCHQ